jgi:hypothetical protein
MTAAVAVVLEHVLVPERPERPAGLLVDEPCGSVERRDARGHREPDAEVARPPGDRLPSPIPPAVTPSIALLGCRHRRQMRIDVEREVEQPLAGDARAGDDREGARHASILAAARRQEPSATISALAPAEFSSQPA